MDRSFTKKINKVNKNKRKKKKKVNKVTVTLNDTLDQIKLTDNFKTLCPTQQKSFQVNMEHCPGLIGHMLTTKQAPTNSRLKRY